ncbi:MAG: dihydrofolate reductase [Melioribacteraceae bacterium]|nr:dihydrofolate reductase [Melioribacteraceae bacterium]
MKKILISAVSQNNIIGRNNKIPWNNKEELKYFKETTLNHAVLMGRKTYDSIGKPLPKRINLIISRDIKTNDKLNNLFYFESINEALKYAENLEVEKTFIIGGSEIYSQSICKVDELLISRMPFEIAGDKYFPDIKSEIWKLRDVQEFNSFKVESYFRRIVKD